MDSASGRRAGGTLPAWAKITPKATSQVLGRSPCSLWIPCGQLAVPGEPRWAGSAPPPRAGRLGQAGADFGSSCLPCMEGCSGPSPPDCSDAQPSRCPPPAASLRLAQRSQTEPFSLSLPQVSPPAIPPFLQPPHPSPVPSPLLRPRLRPRLLHGNRGNKSRRKPRGSKSASAGGLAQVCFQSRP